MNDIAQALDNPFFRERGRIQEVNHPERSDFKLIASPIRLDEPLPDRPGPQLGADTHDVLAELGYLDWEIESLRDAGVI